MKEKSPILSRLEARVLIGIRNRKSSPSEDLTRLVRRNCRMGKAWRSKTYAGSRQESGFANQPPHTSWECHLLRLVYWPGPVQCPAYLERTYGSHSSEWHRRVRYRPLSNLPQPEEIAVPRSLLLLRPFYAFSVVQDLMQSIGTDIECPINVGNRRSCCWMNSSRSSAIAA